jgi:hypothetical protein
VTNLKIDPSRLISGKTGVYILENNPPPPPGEMGKISAEVILGKNIKRGKMWEEKEKIEHKRVD